MKLHRIVVGELLSNCYLAAPGRGRDAVLIDPGADEDRIIETVAANSLRVKYIVCTHGHIDHIGAIPALLDRLNPAPEVCIHSLDGRALSDTSLNLAEFTGTEFPPIQPDRLLEEGSLVEAEDISLKVLHTPGHTPGGICLLGDETAFTGDTLFASGIGRTDFAGGSHQTLLKSIREKLFTLPDETRIYPGHGPESTIAGEKRSFSEWI